MGTYRAVKIVHREDFGRDRPFAREYEGLLKFEPISRSHPNLMQILHVGRREGYFYYVMELADDEGKTEGRGQRSEDREQKTEVSSQWSVVSGQSSSVPASADAYVPRTLQEDLEGRRRLPVRECVSLATALASALKHFHDHKLIHRDVKPSNVIFVHGVPKLADIGLVAAVGDSCSIVGTEGYLAPEGPGSPQADLYALGKLLYEASTGLDRGEYPRLPQNLASLPDAPELLEFNEVLLKACAKDTARRYHRTEELLADLALLERGDSVRRLRRLERHHAVLKRVGIAALAVGLLLTAAWWQSWRAHRIATRYLAQLHLNEGTRRMVQGDYATALPWLVGALELDAREPTRERIHRLRIANVLQRCPLPVAHFATPDSKIGAADLSPDGTMLATAHDDGWVRLWDIRSGEPIRQLSHTFPAVLCQFLPSGDRLLTVTMGQDAYVWDLAKPEVAPLTFRQDVGLFGEGLYSVGLNEALQRVYLSKAWYCFARTHPFTGVFENLTLSLKLAGQGDVLLVNYAVRPTTPGGGVSYEGEFRDSPAAERFDSGHDNPAAPLWGRVLLFLENSSWGDTGEDSGQVVWGKVRLRRYASGGVLTPWQRLDDFSSGATTNWLHGAFPDEGRTCRVENGQLVLTCARLPLEQEGSGLVMYREPLEISRTHTLELEADLISAQAPHRMVGLTVFRCPLTPLTVPDRPFIAHGRWLASTWWDAPIRIWDLEQTPPGSVPDEKDSSLLGPGRKGYILDIDFSPDTNYVAVVGGMTNLSVWNFRTGLEVTNPTARGGGVTGVRFSPEGRFLAVSRKEGLELLRTGDWQVAHQLGRDASFSRPRFSPRGSRFAAVRDEREVLAWNLDDLLRPLATFPHSSDIQRIAFSPDGRYLASSSANGLAQVWDLARAGPLGPPLPGVLARFSPDGTQLLLISAAGGVWVWDLSRIADDSLALPPLLEEQRLASSARGTMTAEIEGQGIALKTPAGQYSLLHPVPLRRVAFTPDDQWLVAESSDLRGWVWDLLTRSLAGPPRPVRYDVSLATVSSPSLAGQHLDRRTLSDLAALLGQQRPDGAGGMRPVEEAEQVRLLAELKRTQPELFRAVETNRMRWHQEQASASELRMDWDAAVFHWERAVDGKSEVRSPKSEVPAEARLDYARRAAEVVRLALLDGRSRWSVLLPRPPWATPEMVDLGRFYTRPADESGASPHSVLLRELPRGVQVLGGTGFDIRGILQLNRTNRVKIPVGRACQRLHFLHAASQPTEFNRETVGVYQVNYASGARVSVSLLNPDDVPPYSANFFHAVSPLTRTSASPALRHTMVWSGSARRAAGRNVTLFLTRTTWELPENHQREIVQTIELRGGSAESVPLIFAITVE
jgi:WD40 repeat protein